MRDDLQSRSETRTTLFEQVFARQDPNHNGTTSTTDVNQHFLSVVSVVPLWFNLP